ncbi:hypothetical protein BH24ACT22_BH24ACT22_12100 [soil metagenome]
MSEKTQAAARRYISRGCAIIPVPAKEKKPNHRGWQHERLALADVPTYWSNGANIGLLTGAPSGWRVDIDLDTPEAVMLAGRFLSPTLTAGRQSSQHSHWWYVARGVQTATFKDIDGTTTLLELRANGRQSIVAPSIHPDGEAYLWHAESGLGMEEIDPDDLACRVRELATATLIVRHLPDHRKNGGGGRHGFALALAGYLLRPGRLEPKAVERILKASWDIGDFPSEQDRREAHTDLEGIVHDTLNNLQRNEKVVGGKVLEEMQPGLPRALGKYWGWSEPREGETGPEPTLVKEPEPVPWPKLDEAALYGLPGEVVKTIEPHTEADPVALLVNLLCAFGNAAGRGAYVQVGADRHHLNLFSALVGETSKARKGMSWGHVQELLHAVDAPWEEERVQSGLSSGEGLIYAVRDRVETEKDGEMKLVDPGVSDKRLLLVEGEYGKTLKVMSREGNILSAVIRSAWDGDRLKTLTKDSPLKATDGHISIIGHITRSELLRLLSSTDTDNGFANRFLWILVMRSKALPFGGDWRTVDTAPLVRRLSRALEFAKTPREIRWGDTAREMWSEVYGPLSEGNPGLFGAATNRAEAQTLRLAALYAVMDESSTIEAEHLEAALALWSYAEQSAAYIFGNATGDVMADRIAETLTDTPEGMTRTEISHLFKRNRSANRMDQALVLLERLGRIRREQVETGGRPAEKWYAT